MRGRNRSQAMSERKTAINPAMLNPIYIPPLPPIREKTGLVAFMDILGFSNIKADTTEVVEQVFRAMETAGGEKREFIDGLDVRSMMSDEDRNAFTMPDNQRRNMESEQSLVRNRTEVSVISDSFICLCDLTDASDKEITFLTSTFIQMVAAIASGMFVQGLPLRGGISYGSFFHNNGMYGRAYDVPTVFLGEAVLAAHKLETSSNTACICLDDAATEFCKNHYDPFAAGFHAKDEQSDLCLSEVVFKKRDKEGKEVHSRVCIAPYFRELWHDRIEDWVQRAFSHHEKYPLDEDKGTQEERQEAKRTNAEVRRKMDNTIRFLKAIKPWPVGEAS